jgi:hypothetical protein
MTKLDFGGIAQLITALVLVATFVQSFLNGRGSARIEAGQEKIKTDVSEWATNTNSKMDALLVSTAKASKAEGKAEQRDETEAAKVTKST